MVYDGLDVEKLKSYQELDVLIQKVKLAMEEVSRLQHTNADGFVSDLTEPEKKTLKKLISAEFKPFAEEIKEVKRKLR